MRYLKHVFLSIWLVAIMVGCAPVQAPATTATESTITESSTTGTQAEGVISQKELILAAPRDLAPGKADPYFTSGLLHVWESLVTVDENWMPAPQLAESWEVSEDGLSWIFTLRQDVVFSDGTPFNADVVIANVERNLLNSPKSSPFYSFDATTAYGDFSHVEKVDEYTVRFVHNTPQPTFPAQIATYFSAMFSPASFDENGDFIEFPIASGPFMVTEHEPEQYVILQPNPLYRGDSARSAQVRIRVIPDGNTRASALRAGEIHGVIDLSAIQPALAESLVASGDFEESTTLNTIMHYIFVNGTVEPWSDVRLRQALSMAIDREFIVDAIWQNYAIPGDSIISPIANYWHDPAIELPYAPEEAIALAQEVLGGERISARILVPSFLTTGDPYKPYAEYLQAAWEPLGIDAEIQILEYATIREMAAAGDYEISIRRQGLSNSEPASFFDNYLGCERGQNFDWSLNFCEEEVETILQELHHVFNLEQRQEAHYRLQEIAAEKLPVIPVVYEKGLIVFHKDVEGYGLTSNGNVTLETAWVK